MSTPYLDPLEARKPRISEGNGLSVDSSFKLGDWVKAILFPFVKGTRLESCPTCEERRKKLNKASTWVSNFLAKISCPCWYRGLFK